MTRGNLTTSDRYNLKFDYEFNEMIKPLYCMPTLSQGVAYFTEVSSSRTTEQVTSSTMDNVEVYTFNTGGQRVYSFFE